MKKLILLGLAIMLLSGCAYSMMELTKTKSQMTLTHKIWTTGSSPYRMTIKGEDVTIDVEGLLETINQDLLLQALEKYLGQ